MKKKELAEILIKCLGIYTLLHSLTFFQYIVLYATSIFEERGNNYTFFQVIFNVLPFLATIIIGFLLIKYGETLSLKIFKDQKDSELNETRINKKELQTIIFSGVGLFILITTIPKLIHSAGNIYLYLNESMEGEAQRLLRNSWPDFLATFLYLCAGVFVFFQAESITNLWRSVQRLRYEKRQ